MELSQLTSLASMKSESMDKQPPHERIRLVLLDDHVLLRESLAQLLAAEDDF
jgi:hypothetical protein